MTAEPQKRVLLKVIILGESGVGKTAVLNHYVNNTFIQTHKATIGADFLTKELVIDDKTITLQMWDTAGQERFKSLGNAFYRGADAAIVVYDITDSNSFDKIDEWRSNFLELSGEKSKEFPILLLGNKLDLAQTSRAVDKARGDNYAGQNDMIFFETSAMNGTNIQQAIQAVSLKACDRNTAPIFSADVIKQLDNVDNNETPAEAGGCACSLL